MTAFTNKLEEIVYAKVLNEVCKDLAQLGKILKVKEIGKLKAVNSGRVGANRNKGCKGEISNVPLCV